MIMDIPAISDLRNKMTNMTNNEFVELRDYMEANWISSMRPVMQVLSLGCIGRFNTKLVDMQKEKTPNMNHGDQYARSQVFGWD